MKKQTPLKAIRAKCLDCCCGQVAEVRLCTSENCPLFPYRKGHRPKGDKIPDEENEAEETHAFPGETEEREDAEP